MIGELSTDDWIREAVLDYIEKNPMVGDTEIHKHFKMRVDIIASVLADLRTENRIERIVVNGRTHYRMFEITEEELLSVSLPMPFGNFKSIL